MATEKYIYLQSKISLKGATKTNLFAALIMFFGFVACSHESKEIVVQTPQLENAIAQVELECPSQSKLVRWSENIFGINKSVNGTYSAIGCVNTDGEKNGRYLAFYTSGKIVQRGQYAFDFPDKKHETFYETGQYASIATYTIGTLDRYVIWSKNGTILKEKK